MKNEFIDSDLYRHVIEEREEILKYKWIESEKTGYDIGWYGAQRQWNRLHKEAWEKSRKGPTK